jgi:hypothetical protein
MIDHPSLRRPSAWVSTVAAPVAPAPTPARLAAPAATTPASASPVARPTPTSAPIASDAPRIRQRTAGTGFCRAASSTSRSRSATAQLSRSIHAVCVQAGHAPCTSLRYPQWSHRFRQSKASFAGPGPLFGGFRNRR